MRTIVVGDVHGCLEELKELLDKAKYKPKVDKLLFLGDLVDRGPDSAGVVRYVRQLQKDAWSDFDTVNCVMGNHEEKHVRFAKREKECRETGKKNMMQVKPYFMSVHATLTEEDLQWMSSLPVGIQVNKFWIAVHAGFTPGKSAFDQDPKVMLRVRFVDEKTGAFKGLGPNFSQPDGTRYWSEMWDGSESVIYGHCVRDLERPMLDGNSKGACCLGIDTGCVFGGNLTAAIIEDDVPLKDQCRLTTVQVKAHQAYAKGWALGSDLEG